jgi:nucleoside-diphosphate-sugar epimerase
MILVTGASGCVGAQALRHVLAEGAPVAAMLLPGDPAPAIRALIAPGGPVQVRRADLLDRSSLRSALQGVTELIHCAGFVSPVTADEPHMFAVNVLGTQSLMEAALDCGVRRVVHVSSIAAVGYSPSRMDENHVDDAGDVPWAYRLGKREAERRVLALAAQGLDVCVACPAALLAPGCDRRHGWGRLFEDVALGRLRWAPPGAIDFIGADDLGSGLLAVLRRGRRGERYILSSGAMRYHELMGMIAQSARAPWTVRRIPLVVMRAMVTGLRLFAPVLRRLFPQARVNAEVLELSMRQVHYDNSKARRELSWLPKQSLSDAVADTYEALFGPYPSATPLLPRTSTTS